MFEIEFRELVRDALKDQIPDETLISWGVGADGTKFPAALIYCKTETDIKAFGGYAGISRSTVRVDLWSEDVLTGIRMKNAIKVLDSFEPVEDGFISEITITEIGNTKHSVDNSTVFQFMVDFVVWHN